MAEQKSELVADQMFEVFANERAVNEFVAKERTFAQNVLDHIKGLIAEIKNIYKKLVASGQYDDIAAWQEDLKALEKVNDMMLDALANIEQRKNTGQKAEKNTSDEAVNATKRITNEDVSAAQSIGRKSINDLTSAELNKLSAFAEKYWKELGTKSPFFRAWFGDWRENDISPSTVIKVTKSNYNTATRTVINKDMSKDDIIASIKIDDTIFNDSISYAKRNGDEKQIVNLLSHIDEIISNAIYLDTQTSEKGKANKKGSTSFMHYLYCPIEYNGAPFIAKITIEEYDVDGKQRAYNAQRIKLSSLPRAHFSILNKDAKTRNIRLQDDEITVADLFSIVKKNDKNFSPKPASKIVNADGTPMTVYHGSPNKFTVFNPNKLNTNGNAHGRGFYFTEEKSLAEGYSKEGGQLLSGYLNITNPMSEDIRSFTKLLTKYLRQTGHSTIIR